MQFLPLFLTQVLPFWFLLSILKFFVCATLHKGNHSAVDFTVYVTYG